MSSYEELTALHPPTNDKRGVQSPSNQTEKNQNLLCTYSNILRGKLNNSFKICQFNYGSIISPRL